jgi:hypothetical protein
MAGVKAAVEAEIGWDRVISADLHTDESSPHVHIVFAPVLDNKLQAKHWVGGPSQCAQLRDKIHAQVTKHLVCDYTKGAVGGMPHDPQKAVGKSKAVDGMVFLKAAIDKLQQQVQTLFSALKAEQKKALKAKAENDEFALKAMKQMEDMQAEIARLSPPLKSGRMAAPERAGSCVGSSDGSRARPVGRVPNGGRSP